MFQGQVRGKPCHFAPFAVLWPDDVLLSGCGTTVGFNARRTTTNDRGPAKGPLTDAPRIRRDASSGRIFANTQPGAFQ